MAELKRNGIAICKKMEDYGLSEYLEIKQKYFDAYIESLSDDN